MKRSKQAFAQCPKCGWVYLVVPDAPPKRECLPFCRQDASTFRRLTEAKVHRIVPMGATIQGIGDPWKAPT